jgi:carbon monoxide dehydrogenase subunit G
VASIRKDIVTTAAPEKVWDVVRDVGALHTRLVPGFVVDTQLEDGARVVSFANGLVARELIVDVDDTARRLAYAVDGGAMSHHHATVVVEPAGADGSRVVWQADLLPHDLADQIGSMMDAGAAAMQQALDRL